MTLLDTLRGAIRGEQRATPESPLLPLTSSTLIDWVAGPATHSGVHVNEKRALALSAVWRAVQLLAGTAASLPLHAYTSKDDIRIKAGANQQSTRLLREPHPDLTPFEFWEIVFIHLLLWGNAYIQLLRAPGGQVAELWPIHPSAVKPMRGKDLLKRYQIDGEPDPEKWKTDKDVLHIPGFGYDGIVGLSPIQVAKQNMGLGLAAEEFGARFYGSGIQASGFLATDRSLKEEQARRIQTRWRERVTGLSNAHEVGILDNGAKFHQLTIPPADAQFIESRRFQIAEIARIFGVPAHMLMDTERSTSWGSGIEQQGIGFVVYTLRPWLTRVEQRVSRLLQPGTIYAKYGVEGLLRGDSKQRAAFYTAMWNIGVFNTDEIRALEDMPPVEGGQVRYRPLNMGELGVADPEDEPDDDEPQQPALPASPEPIQGGIHAGTPHSQLG